MKLALPLAAALALGGVVLYSCTRKGGGATHGSGPILAESSKELRPDVQPGWKANLAILSTDIPVDVDQKIEGSEITLRLLSFGEELEVERYKSTPASFELLQMAGEEFSPPLPLLQFPVRGGSQIPWKGKLVIGELERNAEATIRAKQEPMKEKGFENAGAIRVTVDLKIDGGAPTRASRMLDFWFVEGKGLLKREIDKGSTRFPIPDGPEGAKG